MPLPALLSSPPTRLNNHFHAVGDIIRTHGGVIAQSQGNAVLTAPRTNYTKSYGSGNPQEIETP